MRLYNLNQKDKTAVLQLDGKEEIELVEESIDLLIKKQEKTVKLEKDDLEEVQKLEKYKKTKKVAIEIPKKIKENQNKLKDKLKKNIEVPNDRDLDDIKTRFAINSNSGDGGDEGDKASDYIDIESRNKSSNTNNNNTSRIHHKNIFDIVHALNEHINQLELDQTFKSKNKDKYKKLQRLLDKAQENKALFESRETPKPKGFGKLKK